MAGKEVVRKKNGQFPKGVSGNPDGRPLGSKNKITTLKLMVEQLAREEHLESVQDVIRLIIQQALEGDHQSQKLVWEAHMSKGIQEKDGSGKEKVEININAPEKAEKRVVEIVQDGEITENT